MLIDETVEKDHIGILENVPILYADKPGRNLNIYEEEEILKGIQFFENATKLDGTYRYVYIRHTNDSIGEQETLQLVAGWIDRIWYDKQNKTVYANVKLLPTTWGKLVKWLVKHNYPVGTSIRGTGLPVEKVIDWNGERLTVKSRKNFKLKGFDFVVEPSFITTQIAGEHYIKEQHQKDKIKDILLNMITKEEHLSEKEVCDLESFCNGLCNVSEQTTNTNNSEFINIQGGIKMENLEKEKLQLEVEKLSLQKEMLSTELSKYKEQISKLKEQSEILSKQTEELQTKTEAEKSELENLILLKSEISAEIKEAEQKLEELKAQREELEKAIEENSAKLKELEEQFEVREAKEKEVSIRKFGKVFNEENPPKVRIVDPEERVLTTEWGNVDKDFIRKVAYLAYKGGNKDVTEAFGLLKEGWKENWRQWKYPVCQFVKSEEDGYDFDCVLNLNGLKTALVFMMGRPGMALSYKEKKELAKNLLKWYKKAKEAGRIENIPESLMKVAESSFVLTGDEIIDSVLETLQLRGYLNIELSDEVKEQSDEDSTKLEIEPEEIFTNISKAVADALLGNIYHIDEELLKVVEQVTTENGEEIDVTAEIDRFLNIVLENLSFESIEEIKSFIKQVLESENPSDLLVGLKPLASAVIAKLVEQGIPADKASNYVFNILAILADELKNEEQPAEEQPTGENLEEQPSPGNNELTMESANDNPLYEQSNKENTNSEEDIDMEKLNALIALINDNFDVDVEVTPDNVLDIVSEIFKQHVSLNEQIAELQAKVEELAKANEVKEKSGEASEVEEDEKVTEQAKERKGTIVTDKDETKETDMLSKLFKIV